MTVSFACGRCGRKYEVDRGLAGKRAKCKECGALMTIPAPGPASPPPPRPSPPPGAGPAGRVAPPRPKAKPAGPARDPYGLEDDGPAAGRSAPAQAPDLDEYGLAEAPPPPPAAPETEPDDVVRPRRPGLAKAKPRPRDDAEGGGGGPNNIGVWMLIIGVGSFLLPLVGLQFKLIGALGEYQMVAGGLFAVVGLVLVVTGGSSGPSRATRAARPRKSKTAKPSLLDRLPPLGTRGKLGVALGALLLLGLMLISASVMKLVGALLILAGVVLFVWGWFESLIVPFRESALCGVLCLNPFYWIYYVITRWEVMGASVRRLIRGGVLVVFALLLYGVGWVREVGQRRAPVAAARPRVAKGRAPEVAAWRVVPDPPPSPPGIQAGQEVEIPIPASFPSGPEVIYPTTPSPFVAVGRNGGPDEVREVWDLRTNQRTASIRGNLGRLLALSPDGQYGLLGLSGQDVVVWSFAAGRAIRTLDHPWSSVFDAFDFVSADSVACLDYLPMRLRHWDFQTGVKGREIKLDSSINGRSLALSPGRRFLALGDDRRLWTCDLKSGIVAGTTTLPVPAGGHRLRDLGLSFSPDGVELAGAFEASDAIVRILVWDLASGRLVVDHGIAAGGGDKGGPDAGPYLQWLPDRSGWILGHDALVDRRSGARFGSVPLGREGAPHRVLDDGRVLAVAREGRDKVLRSFPLPRNPSAAATP